MIRNLAILVLASICAYQQWKIRELIFGLAHYEAEMQDAVWSVPPPPCVPCETALYNLTHPRYQ